MRHLRPFTALIAIAALTVACSSPGASSGGESSQGGAASEGGTASQPAASIGGGGGGGANGSIVYEITGEYQASGELPFLAGGVSLWIESAGGWVANFGDASGAEGAVILLNTQTLQAGQGLTYGDGSVVLTVISDPGSGMGCTFTLDKNDPDGLKGDVECTSAFVVEGTTGGQKAVHLTASWDAHP